MSTFAVAVPGVFSPAVAVSAVVSHVGAVPGVFALPGCVAGEPDVVWVADESASPKLELIVAARHQDRGKIAHHRR
jgi:hypothetical protein